MSLQDYKKFCLNFERNKNENIELIDYCKKYFNNLLEISKSSDIHFEDREICYIVMFTDFKLNEKIKFLINNPDYIKNVLNISLSDQNSTVVIIEDRAPQPIYVDYRRRRRPQSPIIGDPLHPWLDSWYS